jgi:predicted dithiol-disulfide oxidoreductase (DUF899 family)
MPDLELMRTRIDASFCALPEPAVGYQGGFPLVGHDGRVARQALSDRSRGRGRNPAQSSSPGRTRDDEFDASHRSKDENNPQEADAMTEHKTGTREEWQTARDELASLEAEHAELSRKVAEKRRELPWVPVDKKYEFDTEDGKKTLAELFDGRSQLLAYNIMFGPDYKIGACPGCSNLGDELDATRVHLNHHDVTLICFSRAPSDRLTAYKQRMHRTFPYVSTYRSDFPFDFELAMTPEQAEQIPEVKEMVDNPPGWLQDWSQQVGADLKDGLRENPTFIAFARENATVYHT